MGPVYILCSLIVIGLGGVNCSVPTFQWTPYHSTTRNKKDEDDDVQRHDQPASTSQYIPRTLYTGHGCLPPVSHRALSQYTNNLLGAPSSRAQRLPPRLVIAVVYARVGAAAAGRPTAVVPLGGVGLTAMVAFIGGALGLHVLPWEIQPLVS